MRMAARGRVQPREQLLLELVDQAVQALRAGIHDDVGDFAVQRIAHA